MADPEQAPPPSVLGSSKSALRRIAEVARQVLRDEGFSEKQIDALLKRRYAQDDERR